MKAIKIAIPVNSEKCFNPNCKTKKIAIGIKKNHNMKCPHCGKGFCGVCFKYHKNSNLKGSTGKCPHCDGIFFFSKK